MGKTEKDKGKRVREEKKTEDKPKMKREIDRK